MEKKNNNFFGMKSHRRVSRRRITIYEFEKFNLTEPFFKFMLGGGHIFPVVMEIIMIVKSFNTFEGLRGNWLLISPHSTTLEWNVKVMRIKENNHQFKNLLIVKQILFVSSMGKVKRTVTTGVMVQRVNPLTPMISLVILLTVCQMILIMLVWRIWYWITQ